MAGTGCRGDGAGEAITDMPGSTIRWFAASGYPYACALAELTIYAREHSEDFTLGPLDLGALEHQGLAVSGPDLAGVTRLLDGIPGLTREQ